MCGIAGIVNKQGDGAIASNLYAMSQSLKHRGPDGEGFLLANIKTAKPFASDETPVKTSNRFYYLPDAHIKSQFNHSDFTLGLAHRRLSIIDVTEAGHQPMCDENRNYWISFNGEIYNYVELRQQLKNEGFSFYSNSDTEVLIKAYQHWGEACVERFNGMWAFCIYDVEKQILLCSRDRLGVKPLYYVNTPQLFAFASEQKAFIKSGLLNAKMNEKALHDYLVNGRLESTAENFFDGVLELFPGHQLCYDLKTHQLTLKRYFNLSDIQETTFDSDSELVTRVKATFQRSVQLRLRSDVEVGTCLSGGIDSSSIAVTMAAFTKKSIHCFTSDFEGGEGKYAKVVAEKINAIHHICSPTENELFNDLENLTYALDAPTWDTSTYAQYSVMRLAKQNNIKVVLDGQGADELFAGYHHHYVPYWNNLPFSEKLSAFRDAKKAIANPLLFYFKEQVKQQSRRHYNAIRVFFESEFVNAQEYTNPTKYSSNLNELLRYDIEVTRLKTFLRCEDRCGMWHSVESRTPFSDDSELIKLAFEINGQQKIKAGKLKYLLREAMRSELPELINERFDKMGFTTPMQQWLSKRKIQMLEIVKAANFSFVNYTELEKKVKSPDMSFLTLQVLYKLYLLCLWQKVFK